MTEGAWPRPRPPLFAIALLSAAMLSYELLLMRLFSIIQWHHFAYMIISLALLGYGVSGTFITLFGAALQRRFPEAFIANIGLFAVTSWWAFMLAQALPFNPEELLWHWGQLGVAVAIYLLLAVPFFFAANGIVLALARYQAELPRVYGWDLLGAGLGGLAVVALLFVVPPSRALELIGLAAVLAGMVGLWELGLRSVAAWLLLALAGLIFMALPPGVSRLTISPYKSLSQTLQTKGTVVELQRSSPLGLLTVVASPEIPFRHAPGFSLMGQGEPPEQLGLFLDGDAMAAINGATGESERLEFLTRSTAALPYRLRPIEKVLLVGLDGDADVLRARHFDTADIQAVELNPQVVALLKDDYARYTGGLLRGPDVTVHVGDARGFMAATDQQFDLIQYPTRGGFGSAVAGLYTLNEDFLFTAEAIGLAFERLRPGGYLAFNLWAKVPPRDTLKLLATVRAALEEQGVRSPQRSVILLRSWQTTALLVKRGAFASAELDALRAFNRENGFDLAYYPGITSAEVNRRSVLAEPSYYLGATALLGPRAVEFSKAYKFMIEPATDQRPYFFNFFKWRTLPEIWRARDRGGMALLEAGYPVVIGTLAQAVLASLLLILLPLRVVRRAARRTDAPRLWPTFVAVGSLGFGFMFVEIIFIQRLTLLLSHPLYAVTTALTSFLVFAGAGSLLAHRLLKRHAARRLLAVVVPLLLIAGLLALLAAEGLVTAAAGWGMLMKVTIAALLIAPLACLMGMPFPTMLSALDAAALPWAWAVNGCASVVGAVLATLLAVHVGAVAVVLLALALYWLAGFAFTGHPLLRSRAGVA